MQDRVVHVVDDDEGVRRITSRTLASAGFEPVCYASGAEFLGLMPAASPGCILLDIRMPDLDGLRVQELLQQRGTDWPILILTGYADLGAAIAAMKRGALEFLQKPCRKPELVSALNAAFSVLEVRKEQAERLAVAQSSLARLSPREIEVLEALGQGMAHKVVAHELGISIRTVEVHRAQLLKKLGVRSLSEALRISFEAKAGAAQTRLPSRAIVDSPSYT